MLATKVERLDPDVPVVRTARFELVVGFDMLATKVERLDPDVPLVRLLRLDPEGPAAIVERVVSVAVPNVVLKF